LFGYNTWIGLPGSDDSAKTLVQSITPNYRPWFEGFGLELNATTETLLFIAQIALGVLLLFVCLRQLRKKKVA
jgi:cobalt transport protein